MKKSDIDRALIIYIKSLNKEDVKNFKNIVGIDLKDIILEVILDISDQYKSIGKISKSYDDYDSYIFKPDNDGYDIESFLLNRLFRNICEIKIEKTYFGSEYRATEMDIIFDQERILRLRNSGRNDQVKKLVKHELLHAFKTVPYKESDFIFSNKYCKLKRLLQINGIKNINDFDEKKFAGTTLCRNHISTGIGYRYLGKQIYPEYEKYFQNYENADEIFNEIDSIDFSNIQSFDFLEVDDNNAIAIKNPDSSNVYITNYGKIVKSLLEQEVWFYGQYLKPEILVENFNRIYGKIFKKYDHSNEEGFDIFAKMIDKIKKNPHDVKSHSQLLECLYECMNLKNQLFPERPVNPKLFRTMGLLDLKMMTEKSTIAVSPDLAYASDLDSAIESNAIRR